MGNVTNAWYDFAIIKATGSIEIQMAIINRRLVKSLDIS